MQGLQVEKLSHFKYVNGIFVTVVKYGRKGARMKQLTKLLNKSVKICNDLPHLQHSQGFCSSRLLWEINCYDRRAWFCKCYIAGIIPLTALASLCGNFSNTWCLVSQFWDVKVILKNDCKCYLECVHVHMRICMRQNKQELILNPRWASICSTSFLHCSLHSSQKSCAVHLQLYKNIYMVQNL